MATANNNSALRACDMLGKTVRDSTGLPLGEIDDLVLDKDSNQVLCAVLVFEGLLGGNKYHPVPLALLRAGSDDGSYTAGISKDQLRALPAHSVADIVQDRSERRCGTSGYAKYKDTY